MKEEKAQGTVRVLMVLNERVLSKCIKTKRTGWKRNFFGVCRSESSS